MPYILIIVDNYAYAVQNYPDLPDFLLSYIRDGANYGMYFINAVSTVSSMNYRLAENVKNKMSLFMSEKGDYSSIFSMPPGITIDNIKGHGICKYDKYCVEFETALPIASEDENERVLKVRELVNKIDDVWKGSRAKEIPLLPEKINYKSYNTENILLGLSKNTVENVEININERPFAVISEYRNNVFIDMLYDQIIDKYKIKTKLLYGDFSAKEPDYSYVKEKFSKDLDEIVAELEQRKSKLKDGDKLDTSKYPYILIFIKSYSELLEEAEDNVRDILANIASLGKDLNVIIIAQDASNRMSQNLKNDKFIIKSVDIGTLILIGGTISDNHSFVNLDIPFAEKNSPILLNEAYVLKKNEVGEVTHKYIRTCVK